MEPITTSKPVEAKLPYLKPTGEAPISHAGYPELENLDYDWHSVAVANARTITGGATLRAQGFSAIKHNTAVACFDDSDEWKHQFVTEVKALLMEVTGACEIVFPMQASSIRSVKFTGSLAPASFCHNDFTSVGAARHISNLDPEKADARLSKRYAAYNVWRLISKPPQDIPLALCDARSVQTADLIHGKAYYGGPENTTLFGDMAMFSYNPEHRWYYFPDLGNDELLVWCGYDSDPSFASIVPHTAFRDSTCAESADARTNVDGRCFAFFD